MAGTELVTRDDSSDLLADLEEALGALKLERDDVLWEHPNISRARVTDEVAGDVRRRLAEIVLLQMGAIAAMVATVIKGIEAGLVAGAFALQALAVLVAAIPLFFRWREKKAADRKTPQSSLTR